MNHAIALQPLDWLNLFLYYISISLLAVGGAIATAPDMHRFLVERQGWLTDLQFNASIAIAQAAPGPNVLFIALLGRNVGINAGGAGPAGRAAETAAGVIGKVQPVADTIGAVTGGVSGLGATHAAGRGASWPTAGDAPAHPARARSRTAREVMGGADG